MAGLLYNACPSVLWDVALFLLCHTDLLLDLLSPQLPQYVIPEVIIRFLNPTSDKFHNDDLRRQIQLY